jgi:hypothetical protein
MATTTPTPLPEGPVTAPEGSGPRKLRRLPTRRGLLSWAGVLAAIAAAVTLAVLTLTGGHDDTNPVVGAHNGLIEHGSIRSIEGSVEDNQGARSQPTPGHYPPNYYPHGYDYGAADDAATGGTVPPVAPSGLTEHGSVRSSEGSVEDSSNR